MPTISFDGRAAATGSHRARIAAAIAEGGHPRDFRQWCASARGAGWRSFAELIADEEVVSSWFRTAMEEHQDRDEVAGSLMCLRLAAPVIDLAVSLLILKGWAVALPPGGVMLQVNRYGAATAVALRDPRIEHEDATGQGPAIYAALANQLGQILQMGFVAIKQRTRYGLRGMWGQAADQIAGTAVRRARLLELDQSAAWQAAMRLIDALSATQSLIRMRPRPFYSVWPGGPATVAVKGSCCLYFKVSHHTDDRRYCSNCPLLTDECRRSRAADLLAREHEHLCQSRSAA